MMLCWLAFAGVLYAQDVGEPSFSGENGGPRKATISRPDDDFPTNEVGFDHPVSVDDREDVSVPSDSTEESHIQGEFFSTSRAVDSQHLTPARTAASESNQFWAFHELMLSSVASTGAVSSDILSTLDASSLSRENKTLLLARHRSIGESVDREFSSSSRYLGLKDLDPTNKNSKLRQTGRDIDRERLKVMSNAPRPGRDYTKVYVRNNTREKLWVAIRYVPFEWNAGNESTLAVYEPDTDGPFDTFAWFELAPGERAHLANTANLNFYFYAENQGRSRVWAGTHNRPVDGRSIGFKINLLMAPQREEHTINLN